MSADFFDSNILVYLFADRDPRKRAIAERLVRDAITSNLAVKHTVCRWCQRW
jgi:predicted nucleic acid-binding protein